MTERPRGAATAGVTRSAGRALPGWLGRVAAPRRRPEPPPAEGIVTVADLVSARGLGPARPGGSEQSSEPDQSALPQRERPGAKEGSAGERPDAALAGSSAPAAESGSRAVGTGSAVPPAGEQVIDSRDGAAAGDGSGPAPAGESGQPEPDGAAEPAVEPGHRDPPAARSSPAPAHEAAGAGDRRRPARLRSVRAAAAPVEREDPPADEPAAEQEAADEPRRPARLRSMRAAAAPVEQEDPAPAQEAVDSPGTVDESRRPAWLRAMGASSRLDAAQAPEANRPPGAAPEPGEPGVRPAPVEPSVPPNPTAAPDAELVAPPWARVPAGSAPPAPQEPAPEQPPAPDEATATDRLVLRKARPSPAPRRATADARPPAAARPLNRFSVAPRPTVVDDLAITGLTRRSRGRWGSLLFRLFFIFVFAVIVLQLVDSLLFPLTR